MYILHKKAFTLVELIVVVTILAILATIAYVWLGRYFQNTRDSARIYDMQQMTNVLELYSNTHWEYPVPSDYEEVTFSWALAWKQGTFWRSVILELRSFWNDIPVDPLYGNEYSYSTTNNQSEYQIGMMRETFREEVASIELVGFNSQVYASNIPGAFIAWNYNNFVVRATDGTSNYFIASPSIIAANLESLELTDIVWQQRLAYDNFFNIPASYTPHTDTLGWFNFNVSNPLVFTWSIDELRNEQALLDFDAQLKFIYATTPTESFARYISLLQTDSLTSLKSFLTSRFGILFRNYFNCKDILDDGVSTWDGLYVIDPQWNGELETVYCDMTTDGGWWTRVWENHLLNPNFSWGTHVFWAEPVTWLQHEIVPLSSEVDGNNYALRQTGNFSSHYRLWFQDPSILRQWYEIRMSAWRSDSSTDDVTDVTIMGWKNSPWTVSTCTSGESYSPAGCYFSNFNRKLLHEPNFWDWGLLSDISVNVRNPVSNITSSYLEGWVLFDGFIPSESNSSQYGWVQTYTQSEMEAIDSWVQAGWFLISTNNESTWDPLGRYFDMPTIQYWWSQTVVWDVEDISHPLIDWSIWLWVDLRWQSLVWVYARAALGWQILPGDIILARDSLSPHLPTVLLRRHGQWYILFVSDDGMFMAMWWGDTFDANNNQTVFASNIMTFAIETAAWINPRDGYIFHNRIFYSDGTFSLNGLDRVLETITVDDNGTPRVWTREQVRHPVYQTPENFTWYLWLDAHNNKEIYYTWLSLELYYR